MPPRPEASPLRASRSFLRTRGVRLSVPGSSLSGNGRAMPLLTCLLPAAGSCRKRTRLLGLGSLHSPS
eukprot:10412700-Alexandrium_andersonii.AAC.1